MAGGHSCDQEFDVEAAVKADGEVLGLKIRDTDDVGGSISTLTIHFTNKLNNLFNTYKVQHLRLEGRSVLTNKCPVVPNRGIGKPGMCFVWERMMDRIAQELGARSDRGAAPESDCVRISSRTRRRTATSTAAATTRRCSTRSLVNVGYDERSRRQAAGASVGRTASRRRLLGIGVVIGVEPGGRNAARDMAIFPQSKQMPGAGGVEGATVKIEKNGSVVFTLGSPSCGQSHETTASQIVADVLRRAARADRDGRHVRFGAARRGASRPPTAATTSISTTSAPSTARRRGFATRCSRSPRTC